MKNPSQNATVLIVEDEAIVAADLAGKLRRLGYEVAGIADSGEVAIELACRLLPHVVLMDVRIKGSMNVCSRIDVPVISMMAHSDIATLERARISDSSEYILKPFNGCELESHVELAISRAGMKTTE